MTRGNGRVGCVVVVILAVALVVCCARFVAFHNQREEEADRAAAEYAAAPVPEVVPATPSAPPEKLALPAEADTIRFDTKEYQPDPYGRGLKLCRREPDCRRARAVMPGQVLVAAQVTQRR